jgi:mono/diheme cytochrome c family protein
MSERGPTSAAVLAALRRGARTWLVAFLAGAALGGAVAGAAGALGRSEWALVQADYNRRLAGRGVAPVPVGVRSLTPGLRGGEERCVTCHLGMVLPETFPPDGSHPFGPHPDSSCALSVRELGCTVCHGGEPLAIATTREAHGLAGGSRRPLRRGLAVQAGCAGCHVSLERWGVVYRPDVTPAVAAGQELYVGGACPACHRIEGMHAFDQRGPDLTRVGLRRRGDELRARLRRPQAPPADPRSPMPPSRLSPADLERLVVFLIAQTGDRAGTGTWRGRDPGVASLVDRLGAPLPSRPNAGAGGLWTRRLGCTGCHRAAEDLRGVPDLRFVGLTRDRRYLESMVRDPASAVPGTAMPGLGAPESVAASIVEYLVLQRYPLPSSPEDVFEEICTRCHGDRRDPGAVVLASRPPGLGEGCPVTSETFVEVVNAGRPRTAMAPWGKLFSARFVEDLRERRAGRCPGDGGR